MYHAKLNKSQEDHKNKTITFSKKEIVNEHTNLVKVLQEVVEKLGKGDSAAVVKLLQDQAKELEEYKDI